jgi:phage FluMu protein Com
MMVSVRCPQCQTLLRPPAPPAAGQKLRCPQCGLVFALKSPVAPSPSSHAVMPAPANGPRSATRPAPHQAPPPVRKQPAPQPPAPSQPVMRQPAPRQAVRRQPMRAEDRYPSAPRRKGLMIAWMTAEGR